uniref:Uncharacterized protein n=1 Tax=Oncorhynchus kisutch TaxID=8019 RepID=A0A8C7LFM3_ONCKI
MATPTRSTRSSRCISLIIPKANTSFGRLSFQFSAACDWNEFSKNFLAPTINSENCFMDCVRDSTTREVKPEERIQEYHIQQNEAPAQKAGLMGPR